MLPLETKQFGGKLLPHSDLPGGGGFLEEASHSRQTMIMGKFFLPLERRPCKNMKKKNTNIIQLNITLV
jgi:hypothetical protein